MKRTLEGMAKAGKPLLREALEAIRAQRDAEDGGAPVEEVECLKLLADSLYQAAVDFQLLGTGNLPESIH